MPEEVNLVITEIRASVEILGFKSEPWGTDIIARVVDQGSKPADRSQLAHAVGLGYRQKHNCTISQQQTILDVRAECVVPDLTDSHIKLQERRGAEKSA